MNRSDARLYVFLVGGNGGSMSRMARPSAQGSSNSMDLGRSPTNAECGMRDLRAWTGFCFARGRMGVLEVWGYGSGHARQSGSVAMNPLPPPRERAREGGGQLAQFPPIRTRPSPIALRRCARSPMQRISRWFDSLTADSPVAMARTAHLSPDPRRRFRVSISY